MLQHLRFDALERRGIDVRVCRARRLGGGLSSDWLCVKEMTLGVNMIEAEGNTLLAKLDTLEVAGDAVNRLGRFFVNE
jgi:hypothetical protein